MRESKGRMGRLRPEGFGALIEILDPPGIVAVNRAMARHLGADESPLWGDPSIHPRALSAPIEAHVAVTTKCPASCPGCYVGAGPDGGHASLGDVVARLDSLADLGVFNIAFGGGEAALHPDIEAIVAHARHRGLVPSLTTSGLGMTKAIARSLRGLAQANVSFDGVGPTYAAVRGYDGGSTAERAV
ncbi:MAG: radical SAM protein, partial [Myxococcales bacterium]|nr:radical SAM protein [Myxococcales bacterium]